MKTKITLTFIFYFYVVLAVSVCNSYSPVEPLEDLYNLEKLPRLRPNIKCKMFSSYDRTGGNNDGFNGTYSKLRLEDGCSVLAEMSGAGIIQRIWFTHSMHRKDGLLALKKEHIKIFVDGAEKPALDVPLEDLFNGTLPQFPKPLAGSAIGGFYCYVPIPYKDGCKVVVEGDDVKFYHITYSELPSGGDIESFSMQMSPEREEHLKKAVKAWSNLSDINALGISDCEQKEIAIKVEPKEPAVYEMPEGPYMVRAVYLENPISDSLAGAGTRLQFFFDSAENPAVDVPFEFFFGQAFIPGAYQSLMLGSTIEFCYNFFPMPYRKNAKLRIISTKPFEAKIKLLVKSLPQYPQDLAYLHALYTQHNPTKPEVYYPWLTSNGTGHYAGTYLVTEGPKGLPYWLEGDERFTIDGELVIHGTGSEDYFNCGWYAVENRLNKAGALPLHGFRYIAKTSNQHVPLLIGGT